VLGCRRDVRDQRDCEPRRQLPLQITAIPIDFRVIVGYDNITHL
jgi:hypothetical protein